MLLKQKKTKGFSYIETGEGTQIVLLHRLMGELSNFGSLTDHFSKNGFKVYAPKIPIYEFSILKTNVSNIAKSISEFLEEVVKEPDRKSTRLNSSHVASSYAVFCLNKKYIILQI